jgi:hypothetical protein
LKTKTKFKKVFVFILTLIIYYHESLDNFKFLIKLLRFWELISKSSAFVGESGGNWEFVLVDGGNGELVFVDGSDGQVVTLGLETGLIGGPGQSELLAFRGNPVRRSLVGVSHNILVSGFAVRVVFDTLHLLLDLGFLAGGVVGLGIAVTQSK